MADTPKNIAASVKQRLLNMARAQGRGFDILLVCFALERLLFRLSQSAHRDNYILKGGMLVTQWLDHDNRETRRSEEHTSELQSLMRISYAVFCLNKKKTKYYNNIN